MGGLASVKDLTIQESGELTALLFNDVGLLQHLPCLGVLEIRDCSKLVSLVAAEAEEQLQLSLPSKLRKIRIERCEVLKSLPKAMMHNNTCLKEIDIYRCDSLMHFAIGQLPPTLKRLIIRSCQNMQILVDGDDINSCGSLLEYLEIRDCPSLKYLTRSGELPATLKHLTNRSCEKLESIAKSFGHNWSLEAIVIHDCENLKSLPMGIHNLSHLDRISIYRCPILDSFSDEVFLSTNLKALEIFGCKKMLALPICIPNLTSLQELEIGPGPSILSFPEGGFPINLTSLSINIEASFNDASLFEWGLYKLTPLKKLEIYGDSCHLVSFPEMRLPVSLTSLSIKGFPNLEYMSSKSFQFLASLTHLLIISCEKLTIIDAVPPSLIFLVIHRCEKFTSFPEDGLPPSLRDLYILNCGELKSFPKFGLSPSLKSLEISKCEKLKSFPEDKLPLSLQRLSIEDCPQLIERCKGREWFKIAAHIPIVYINGAPSYITEGGDPSFV